MYIILRTYAGRLVSLFTKSVCPEDVVVGRTTEVRSYNTETIIIHLCKYNFLYIGIFLLTDSRTYSNTK